MDDKIKKAENLFLEGANCSQAVLGAFCEECGLSYETAMKLAAGFGGGIARRREVCGAVSGMVMAADMLFAGSDIHSKEEKDAHYALIRRLTDAFAEETGSIVCRELLGLAPKQVDSTISEARTPEYYRKRPCKELVGLAASILEKELQARSKK